MKPRQNRIFQDFICLTLTKRDIFLQMKTLQHWMYDHLLTFNGHLIFLASYEFWGGWKLVFFILILLFQVPKNTISYDFFLVWIQVIVPCDIRLFEAPNHPIYNEIPKVVWKGVFLKRTFWNITTLDCCPHERVRNFILICYIFIMICNW